MKYIALSLVFLCALGARADVKTVTVLDRGEPNEAMVFHADHLWVGSSRTGFNADYKILVFDRADKKVAEIPLNHSVQFLYAYDAKSVIAVGTGHTPNLTMYTIASRNPDTFKSVTKVIPAGAWANRWLGTVGGREYFTDPGGNPEDETTDLSLPAQTIFRMNGATPWYLPTRLRLPVGGVTLDKTLYVIQKEAIGAAKSNLAVIDSATGKMKLAFLQGRNDLSGIAKLGSAPELAVIERGADKLVFLGTTSLTVLGEIATGREPRALTTLGRCVLTGSFTERGVRLVARAKEGSYSDALELANPLAESEFRRLFSITADEKTGRVYARSNFPCNPMTDACTEDYNRVITWPEAAPDVLKACL